MARTSLGARRRALLVTALALGGVAVVLWAYPPLLAADLPRRQALAVLAGGWLVSLFAIRLRERRAWRRHVTRTRFSFMGPGGRYPPLQGRVGGRTVTVDVLRPSLLSRARTHVSTSVDAAADGTDNDPLLAFGHVGEGARGEGRTLDNPTLEDRLVVTDADEDAVSLLFTTDVQAALMDLPAPAVITVESRHVSCSVPGTRLEPAAIGACATAVVALASEVEASRL